MGTARIAFSPKRATAMWYFLGCKFKRVLQNEVPIENEDENDDDDDEKSNHLFGCLSLSLTHISNPKLGLGIGPGFLG